MSRQALALRATRTRRANDQRGLARLKGVEFQALRDPMNHAWEVLARTPKHGILWRAKVDLSWGRMGAPYLANEKRHRLLTDAALAELKRRAQGVLPGMMARGPV